VQVRGLVADGKGEQLGDVHAGARALQG
jgi:hypothetical protein